jgi:hypothetical protein
VTVGAIAVTTGAIGDAMGVTTAVTTGITGAAMGVTTGATMPTVEVIAAMVVVTALVGAMLVTVCAAEVMTDVTAEVLVDTVPVIDEETPARLKVEAATVAGKPDVGMVAKAETGIKS